MKFLFKIRFEDDSNPEANFQKESKAKTFREATQMEKEFERTLIKPHLMFQVSSLGADGQTVSKRVRRNGPLCAVASVMRVG